MCLVLEIVTTDKLQAVHQIRRANIDNLGTVSHISP